MKRAALFLTVAALLAGCCPCRHLTTATRDSVRVETIIRTDWVADTVLVEVPVEVFRQTVRDTTSHLETSFALSDARINPDGSLSHSLANKAGNRPVAAEKEIVYRDSLVYRDREVENVVEVPRPLTWWQRTQIRGFWMLLAILIIICRKHIAAVVKRVIG
ncbi:MAG: hypothetical protein NC209_03765 [Alistipes sp.]|nr:hypothetical protein [Lachnospiraceae bacterium]MCM1250248.1 hypothetical protein [Alistipes sp.]